ncbi:VOC family protein [Streptomyces sp. NPDC001848]|uniref:VOC family protein n=1 Tax=Streptomyces sp. NPDC001848 TaxID=3364618 RepID=UPI00369E76B9
MTMIEAPGSAGPTGTAHERHAPGTPCWVSLMVHGMAATQQFYRALFGWEFRPGPRQLGPYVRALLHGHEVAGIGQLPPDRHLPIAWTPYLGSHDVDATAETVRSCGGTVGVGPLVAAEAGRLAIACDPTGAVFGIWQAAEHPVPQQATFPPSRRPATTPLLDGQTSPAGALRTGLPGLPGTPAWNELLTYDTASVAPFYRNVFGYEEEPAATDDSDYRTLRIEGRPVAGIRGVGHALPRDRGPHWMTYFQVEDADVAAERVTELGGHVVRPGCDSALGRTVTVADPEGATFSVVSPLD